MGWNCPACGELLKPEDLSIQQYPETAKTRKPRALKCTNCGSHFIVFEGNQPRIYLNSVVICLDDGEDP